MNSKKTTNLTAVSLRNSSLSLWDDQCLGSRGRRVDACSMKLDYVYRTPKLPQGKVRNQLIGQGSETGGIPRCFFTIDQLSGSGRRRVDTRVAEQDKTPPQISTLPSSWLISTVYKLWELERWALAVRNWKTCLRNSTLRQRKFWKSLIGQGSETEREGTPHCLSIIDQCSGSKSRNVHRAPVWIWMRHPRPAEQKGKVQEQLIRQWSEALTEHSYNT